MSTRPNAAAGEARREDDTEPSRERETVFGTAKPVRNVAREVGWCQLVEGFVSEEPRRLAPRSPLLQGVAVIAADAEQEAAVDAPLRRRPRELLQLNNAGSVDTKVARHTVVPPPTTPRVKSRRADLQTRSPVHDGSPSLVRSGRGRPPTPPPLHWIRRTGTPFTTDDDDDTTDDDGSDTVDASTDAQRSYRVSIKITSPGSTEYELNETMLRSNSGRHHRRRRRCPQNESVRGDDTTDSDP